MRDKIELDVAILCGGLGKRLREQTKGGQKTMVSFGEKPFLDILIKYLKTQGFSRIVLCTGYHSDEVEKYYNNIDLGVDIFYSREAEPLGTGGAIKNAKDVIESENFLVLNGDCFCQLDYAPFIKFHFEKSSKATLVLSRLEDRKDFGTINVDEDDRILNFREKIKEDVDDDVYVNTGIYCFNKIVFDWMPKEDKFSMENDFFPYAIKKGIYGYKTETGFIDIGTPERYKKAQEILKELNK